MFWEKLKLEFASQNTVKVTYFYKVKMFIIHKQNDLSFSSIVAKIWAKVLPYVYFYFLKTTI